MTLLDFIKKAKNHDAVILDSFTLLDYPPLNESSSIAAILIDGQLSQYFSAESYEDKKPSIINRLDGLYSSILSSKLDSETKRWFTIYVKVVKYYINKDYSLTSDMVQQLNKIDSLCQQL